jgi:uncharacterized delta-60 repeat protein
MPGSKNKGGKIRSICEPLERRQLLTAGDLDPSFGTSGRVSLSSGIQQANATLQPNGQPVVVLSSYSGDNPGGNFAVARYTTAGNPDTTFGFGGQTKTSIDGKQSVATAAAVQPDGKIVLAGTVEMNTSTGGMSIAVVRYNSDGSLDTTFGTGGIALAPGSEGYAVAIEAGGQIVVAGSNESYIPSDPFTIPASTLTVARFTPNGLLDSSFGNGGIARVPSVGNFAAEAVAIDGSNNIVLAGGPWITGGSASLVRLTSTGALDTTFGTGGSGVVPVSSNSRAARTLAITPDGYIVTAVINPSTQTDSVYRFTSAGAIDTTFGQNSPGVTTLSNISASSLGPLLVVGTDDSLYVSDIQPGDTSGTGVGLFYLDQYGKVPQIGTVSSFDPVVAGTTVDSLNVMANGDLVTTTAYMMTKFIPNPASVGGIIFNDTNQNFIQDAGETGLSGWTIWADVNNTGVQAANDPVATTRQDGSFSFTSLSPTANVYPYNLTFHILNEPGYSAQSFSTSLLPGDLAQLNIAETTTSAVTGKVTLADGTTPVAGATIYFDANNNQQLDAGEIQTVTGADGTYRLTGIPGLPAGYRTIGMVPPAGDQQISPANGASRQARVDGPGVVAANVNFEVGTPSSIVGTLYQDSVGAGNAADEVAFASGSGSFYIDTNNDGMLDDGETAVQSNFNTNQILFTGLSPGTYVIRQVPNPKFFTQTIPANNAGVTVTVDGNSLPTFTFADFLNRNIYGTYQTASLNSAAANSYNPNSYGIVPIGTAVQISLAPVNGGSPISQTVYTDKFGDFSANIAGGGTITVTPSVPAGDFTVSPSSATILAGQSTNVSFIATAQSMISGMFYQDTNDDGLLDAGESGLPGATATLNYLGTSGATVVQSIESTTNSDGTYSFTHLLPGNYTLTEDHQSSYVAVTQPAGGSYSISLPSGGISSGNNFGDLLTAVVKPLTGTVIGTSGSYKNDGTTAAKAFDGNLTTFFDGPTASGNWVGLDLGSAKIITSLAYVSRSGWASRMNGGIFQGSNSATFASGVANLYTIASNANPSSTAFTTQKVTNTAAYRYVRYLAPANSYGDVAEIEFFGHAGVSLTRLTGTTIGTAGSYQNDGLTISKATDNNLSTVFVGPTANGNWVGYDLGSSKSISQIEYAPASGWASRLVGGQIQISTSANFTTGVTTIYKITETPVVGSLTAVNLTSPVTARYIRYLSPNGSYGEIAEFQVFG